MKIMILALAFSLFSQVVYGKEIADYHIVIQTSDAYGAGTDNNIAIILSNREGKWSKWHTIQGNSEANSREKTNVRTEDIGIITTICFAMTTRLADDWEVADVEVYYGATSDRGSKDDGWSQFITNKVIKAWGGTYCFSATKIKGEVIISPEGVPEKRTDEITITNFGYNRSNQKQTVMAYTETWSTIDAIRIVTSTSDEVGAELSVGYGSPEWGGGTFSVKASASWKRKLDALEEESTQKIRTGRLDWKFDVSPNSAVFRKRTFAVPYESQKFRANTNKPEDTVIIRKIGGKITLIGNEYLLELPQIINGEIEPVPWDVIQDNWLTYARPSIQKDVRRFIGEWKRKGWIDVDESKVKTEGEVKSATRPQITKKKKPTVTKPDPLTMDYKVTITTGEDGDGGTDANVRVTIAGDNGSTVWTTLNLLKTGDIFEAGDVDAFELKNQKYVGKVTSVTLHFDDAYAGSDWRLVGIAVEELEGKKRRYYVKPNTDLRREGSYRYYVH